MRRQPEMQPMRKQRTASIILVGDVLLRLIDLATESVQCVVTSPPYWGLRDYGVAPRLWPAITFRPMAGLPEITVPAMSCAYGLEPTPLAYTAHTVLIFREVSRVLANDGTLWLNIGDSYSGSGKGGNPDAGKQATNKGSQTIGVLYGKTGDTARQAAVTNVSRRLCAEHGMKAKDLIGIPYMLAFALQADGWYWRAPIVWSKPNPMPGSQRDRPTISHEYLWLMSKSAKYYYDADAIAEDSVSNGKNWSPVDGKNEAEGIAGVTADRVRSGFNARWTAREQKVAKRTKRTVWTITPKPFRGAHFATFPPALVEPCILAGSRVGDSILDPFGGSMTTGVVAAQHGRDFFGIELSEEYVKIGCDRLLKEAGVEAVVT